MYGGGGSGGGGERERERERDAYNGDGEREGEERTREKEMHMCGGAYGREREIAIACESAERFIPSKHRICVGVRKAVVYAFIYFILRYHRRYRLANVNKK